jgi:hypothetical protein
VSETQNSCHSEPAQAGEESAFLGSGTQPPTPLISSESMVLNQWSSIVDHEH